MSNFDSAIEHARILLNNLLEMKNNMHPVPQPIEEVDLDGEDITNNDVKTLTELR